MLTPEQVADIRKKNGVHSSRAVRPEDVAALLADRAEIAQELENLSPLLVDGYVKTALAALIERIGK